MILNKCHFCGESRTEMLYLRGDKKVCSICMKVIIETIEDYVKT